MRENPIQLLANAIILKAVDDYRAALKQYDRRTQAEIERFFLSDWFTVLTKLDGEMLIEKLRKEHQNEDY